MYCGKLFSILFRILKQASQENEIPVPAVPGRNPAEPDDIPCGDDILALTGSDLYTHSRAQHRHLLSLTQRSAKGKTELQRSTGTTTGHQQTICHSRFCQHLSG